MERAGAGGGSPRYIGQGACPLVGRQARAILVFLTGVKTLACLLAGALCGASGFPTFGLTLAPRVGQDARPASEEPPWEEILSPAPEEPAVERPEPYRQVVWRDKLPDAIAEARATGRPLFVTLRCLPCEQCSSFDSAVLEGGSDIDPYLAEFVTVRLSDARAMDLRIFPVEGFQDTDLSWWGWLLSPDLRVYGVFGGKDHVSDASRISVGALTSTLQRVLPYHYDPRRPAWEERYGLSGPAPELSGPPVTPVELPGYASWEQHAELIDCLHCHQVGEVLRQPALDAGTFDKVLDLGIWPLPENVGLELDRDDGLLVTSVEPNSPADRAGIEVDDRLAVASGRLLFGQADFRGALHRGPKRAGEIDLHWWSGERLRRGTLRVAEGWRETPLAWRISISQGNIGAHPGFAWAHGASDAERRRSNVPRGTMAIKPWFGRKADKGPAWSAGLRGDDLIVAVGGKSPDLVAREFMTWFRLHHDPGDEVVLTLRDKRGRERELRYRLKR